MKALVYEEYAPDDNYERILKLKEISDPIPKSNEVVFKVKAAGLNYDDIWGMRGKPIQIPMPHISGTDAAGEVIAVGEDVTTIKVGDRIVSHGNISCRVCNACTDGREYDCRERKIWGFQTGPLWGGYCEITHLPEVNVAKIPDNISYEEAAAASMVLTTSWHMLVGRAKIKPGQTILIMGGGSGMGTFGIQIAKLFDCDVITTSSPDKLDRCLKIGADYAVDHRKEDWHKEVFTITKELGKKKNQSPGVDIIFEHIGGSHW
ncbi:MAG TPA: alcohol dehydrogenase catalytic domain-containing protein, partial [Nitrosopumilaceae archaeon]|nr:alcohol dehydrogenase catalytic domain-containing protein [Nitrosopumilaceae archaeon]